MPRSPRPPAGAKRSETPEVLRALVENHRQWLAFLQRKTGDRALAEDVLQEAFARGLEKGVGIGTQESAVAWLRRLLTNAVIDHYRRRSVAHRGLEALARELGEVQPPEDVRNAVCRCVANLAQTLKPSYAEALRRVEVDGVTVKEYAAEAGITPGNAAVRIFRARQALRSQVTRSCGTCAEHGCLDCTCSAPRSKPRAPGAR